jgi:hypothetical protein
VKPNKSLWLKACFVATFVTVGIPYWLIPYNKLNLPNALLSPYLLVVIISALLLRIVPTHQIWKITWLMGSSVVAVVSARVVVDGIQDPTSHNLWPFEVIIALVVGFPCAFAGAITGSLIANLLPNHSGERES